MINDTVNIIGLGGIGSWVASVIALIGCPRLILWDDDEIERHNFGNQDYDYLSHEGRLKAKATELKLYGRAQWHREYGREMEIVARAERVTAETKLRGIVIVCVDSAEARREIFAACRYNPGVLLYIESGAAENEGHVRVLLPHDKDQVEVYEKFLASYGEGGPAACVTPYMSGQFASLIAHWLIRFNEGWRPQTVRKASIDYRKDDPELDIGPVL
jgi:molybdopterin/thiamine biosynthesis adenylyltransferase